MKLVTVLLMLVAGNAFADTIECNDIATNHAGVTAVSFDNNDSRYADFNKMTVFYADDSSEVYGATNAQALGHIATSNATRSAVFSSEAKGFVGLQYNYFTLDSDREENRRSVKNGLNIAMIVASSQVKMSCVVQR